MGRLPETAKRWNLPHGRLACWPAGITIWYKHISYMEGLINFISIYRGTGYFTQHNKFECKTSMRLRPHERHTCGPNGRAMDAFHELFGYKWPWYIGDAMYSNLPTEIPEESAHQYSHTLLIYICIQLKSVSTKKRQTLRLRINIAMPNIKMKPCFRPESKNENNF